MRQFKSGDYYRSQSACEWHEFLLFRVAFRQLSGYYDVA